MTRILVVDDDARLVRALRINLRARGYDVSTAADGASALHAAADVRPDLVVLDLGLPDIGGVEVIGGLRGWTTVASTRQPSSTACLPARPWPTAPASGSSSNPDPGEGSQVPGPTP